MFSSSNNANPYLPHIPSSGHHLSPPTFIGHNGHEIFLHHNYYHDLLMGHSLPAIDGDFSSLEVPQQNKVNQLQAINGVLSSSTGDHQYYDPLISTLIPRRRPNNKPVKKDRHSKIITAQGQRDRRVRLSIGIARKFFDLQDMLGFDKASKTLDWLLSKSKTAINELVQMKHKYPNYANGGGTGGGFSSSAGCGGGSDDNNNICDDVDVVLKTNPLMMMSNIHEQADHRADLLQLVARESRAKARARARERTREKMSTRQVINESKRLNVVDLGPSSMLIQSSTSLKLGSQTRHITMSSIKINGSEINEAAALSHSQVMSTHEYSTKGSIIDESKLKPTSMFEYQIDHSKQAISSNMQSQHWDERAACSGPVTNITSTSSSGFQIYGKPWEVYMS